MLAAGLVIAAAGAANQTGAQRLQEWVRKSLPPHSAMPPVADISDAKTARIVASPSWEKTYENMEGQFQRDITQMSADVASTPGSLAETRVEQQIEPALPAKGSEAVVIGTVLSGQSHLAANNHVVYSSYQITLDQVLKPSGKRFQRDHQTADVIVSAAGFAFPLAMLSISSFMEPASWVSESGIFSSSGDRIEK